MDLYKMWETEGVLDYTPATFICLAFHERPDDFTLDRLRNSIFMYGWCQGKACWYAIATPETRQLAENILQTAIPFEKGQRNR